jgi:hypothetical protein
VSKIPKSSTNSLKLGQATIGYYSSNILIIKEIKMLTAQIYYEFVKEVEKMRSNINDVNSPVNRNTQILTKQIMQMKYDIENKNREIDRQLNDLKRLITLLSQKLR